MSHFQSAHCYFCNKKFTSRCSLIAHIKRHTNERPYYCGTEFPSNGKRRNHEMTHNPLRGCPHECMHCDKTFHTRSYLKYHIKTVHQNNRPFSCPTCPKKFKTANHLDRHSIRHTGIKKIMCDFKNCDYKTYTNSELRCHKKVHIYGPKKITLAPGWETEDPEFRYQCTFCPDRRKFKAKGGLLSHIRLIHIGERAFNCEQCDKNFKSQSALTIHKRTHLPPDQREIFHCDYCSYTSKCSGSVYSHVRSAHLDLRPFTCERCGKSFRTKSRLNDHDQAVHLKLKEFKCGTCGSLHFNRKLLKGHEATHLPKEERPLFPCPREGCEKIFMGQGQLREHLKCHEGAKCSVPGCFKIFSNTSNLRKHVKDGHSDPTIRGYKCHLCAATFRDNSNLKQHIARSHLKKEQCNCPICGAKFNSKTGLRGHLATYHLESGKRPEFECSHCGKIYYQEASLKNHVAREHEKKEGIFMTCPHCPKSFLSQIGLSNHINVVHGNNEREFKCGFCNKLFLTRSKLNTHILRHVGERPYKCDICGRGCFTNWNLKKHWKTHSANREQTFQCQLCPSRYYTRSGLNQHVTKKHNAK